MTVTPEIARTIRRLEAWTWILLYGGLLLLCFGLAVEAVDFPLGWTMAVAGAAVAAGGVLLIYLRSRLPADTP
jgi:hypothetical protein